MATKNKVKLVLKGILLYTTIIAFVLLIAGIESLYDYGYLAEGILIVIVLVYCCNKFINEEETKILTWTKHNEI